jgi:hypothetical protein
MEAETQLGIDLFKAECEKVLPGCALVIPTKPTGGAFLVSITSEGFRTYATILEDDFADWGEGNNLLALRREALALVNKWKSAKSQVS